MTGPRSLGVASFLGLSWGHAISRVITGCPGPGTRGRVSPIELQQLRNIHQLSLGQKDLTRTNGFFIFTYIYFKGKSTPLSRIETNILCPDYNVTIKYYYVTIKITAKNGIIKFSPSHRLRRRHLLFLCKRGVVGGWHKGQLRLRKLEREGRELSHHFMQFQLHQPPSVHWSPCPTASVFLMPVMSQALDLWAGLGRRESDTSIQVSAPRSPQWAWVSCPRRLPSTRPGGPPTAPLASLLRGFLLYHLHPLPYLQLEPEAQRGQEASEGHTAG